MANKNYKYQAKQVEQIVVRPFSFDFPDDLDPCWVPGNSARAHFFNGVSLTMPYLEPFLVQTIREATGHIEDPDLLEDMRAFNGQEANHYKCHRRLNELLKANGYPELADVEDRMDASYERLSKKSLRVRLAYSAGFECMTNGFTTWLINKRLHLFKGSDPYVVSFWLMHMIEETEHKTVAYDAYMAYSGAYWPRAIGVFHGSLHVMVFSFSGMFTALRKEGSLFQPKRFAAILRQIATVTWNIAPFLFRALLPWHNPRKENDPQWMQDWVAGYSMLSSDDKLPLIDTHHPAMPVPFER